MSAHDTPRARALTFDDPNHLAAQRFLVEEAHALDDQDFDRWLAMLSPAIRYRVPITTTVRQGEQSHKPGEMDHFNEDFHSLRLRIERLRTSFAWSEDPSSRTRRLVSNICAFAADSPRQVNARSSFFLFRSRGDLREPDLLTGTRFDVLEFDEGGNLRLLGRTVHLDESVLRTQNLAILL